MSYPTYAEMRQTNDWIQSVPSHWDIRKLKQVTRLAYGYSLAATTREDGSVAVYGSNGPVGFHSIPNTQHPCIIVGRKGSFGKVNYSPSPVFAIDTTFYIDASQTHHNLRWLYYLLSSIGLDSISQDIGVPGLSREDAYACSVPVPSLPEQRAIVAFLDRKTAEIDELITLKERQIEQLRQKRQVLISDVVTRGLDPNVPMKDSGITWIGDVPEKWQVMRLKFLATKIGSGKTPRGGATVYTDEGVVFLRSQNIYDDGLRLSDVVFISSEIDEEMAETRVYPGDVLLNITGASIGRTCSVPELFPKANVNQHVCIIRPKSNVNSLFLAYCLKSNCTKHQINSLENGSSREGLNFQQVGNLLIVVPRYNLLEQIAIVEYLDAETGHIDAVIEAIFEQIEKMRVYRQALITDAVTGKIDVRDYNHIEGEGAAA